MWLAPGSSTILQVSGQGTFMTLRYESSGLKASGSCSATPSSMTLQVLSPLAAGHAPHAAETMRGLEACSSSRYRQRGASPVPARAPFRALPVDPSQSPWSEPWEFLLTSDPARLAWGPPLLAAVTRGRRGPRWRPRRPYGAPSADGGGPWVSPPAATSGPTPRRGTPLPWKSGAWSEREVGPLAGVIQAELIEAAPWLARPAFAWDVALEGPERKPLRSWRGGGWRRRATP